ncbi:MAG: hypothetical protein WEC15_01305 [Flavobacteriales bacterium]
MKRYILCATAFAFVATSYAQMPSINKLKDKAKKPTETEQPAKAAPAAEPAAEPVAQPEPPAPPPAAKPAPVLKKYDEVVVGMADAKLTAKVLKAAQDHAAGKGWKENFTEAKLVSKDWIIKRNEITGIILARTVDAAVYAVWPDGHCSYQVFGFTQTYDGAKYQEANTFLESVGAQSRCECKP